MPSILMDYPKIRPVEAFPTQDDLIALRDPQGFSEKLLVVPADVFYICTLFDGKHSILEIQGEYTKKFGDLLFGERVRELIDHLDSCLFLENDRFQRARQEVIEKFNSAQVRGASHAGATYESDPDLLRKQLDEIFDHRDGPGLPDTASPTGRMVGLIAPHIDIRRGGNCYARSYWELARECRARTFVILGISHIETTRRFVLTRKDFDTPLGTATTDRELVERIAELTVGQSDRGPSQGSLDFFVDEFAHRNEHSLEFQVVFLQYLFGGREDFKIVPILCTAFHQYGTGTAASSEVETEVDRFVTALSRAIAEKGDVCCIAGVDLSHIGRRFGQDVSLSPELIESAETEDREMLDYVLKGDSEGFLEFIRKENDRRNVCGVPAIYSLLKVLKPGSSTLLSYGRAEEPDTDSLVTFAGAAFYSH